jgi:hypothetical protein
MGHAQLVDVGFHIGDELLEVFGRKVFPRQNQDRRARHQPDGRKIRIRLVRKVRVERDRGGVGSHMAHLYRVAIGIGARRPGRGGRAVGSHHILDDDRLTERACHMIADDASNQVGRPAGGKRHDQRDRVSGIVGLRRSDTRGKAERGDGGNGQDTTHGRFLFFSTPFLVSRSTCKCYHRTADM